MSVFDSGGKLAVFLLWREIFITTGKKVPVVCLAGVSVFGSGGKWAIFSLWREIFITTGKKKVPVVCLAGTRSIKTGKKKIQAGNFHYDRKKKSSSRLSGGCVSFWFWREIGSFFVVAGNFHYDRKKKSQSSVCAGVSVFGSGGKLAIFLLWREIFITTEK